MSIRTMAREKPLHIYFPLAFLLSWYPWLLSLLGVPKASGINPLGPLVAGLILSGLGGGWPAVRGLLARIVRVRVAPQWFAVALLLPALLLAVALAVSIALGAPMPTPAQWQKWPEVLDGFLFTLVFVGLGEEPGWRGYALTQLQRARTPLSAALVLGAIWALWHVPLMGTEFSWPVVPAFLISVFAASVVLAWLYNSARESVLLCMMMHAAVNATGAGYVFRFYSAADLTRLWWVYALVWAAAAALITWRAGPALGRQAATPT